MLLSAIAITTTNIRLYLTLPPQHYKWVGDDIFADKPSETQPHTEVSIDVSGRGVRVTKHPTFRWC